MVPGLPTDGWTVREGREGTLVLNTERFIEFPTLIFDTLPSGQLVTKSGYIVALSNTSGLNPEPRLYHPVDLGEHPKAELRCYPDHEETLNCSVESEIYAYTRFTLLNQLGTLLTFSTPTRDAAGRNNPALTIRLKIMKDANCFTVPTDRLELPHGRPPTWDGTDPNFWRHREPPFNFHDENDYPVR